MSQPKPSRQEFIADFCRRYGIAIPYVFGSRAKEVQAWVNDEVQSLAAGFSDVDIGVKALPGVTWDIHAKVRMAVELEDWLLIHRVDLVVLDETDAFLAANIIRGERLFADNEYLADEYDLYVLRRAGDQLHLERERQQLLLEQES
jgi:predicted nucleotidyltransferase